jgi:hypothetical protein
MSDFWKNVGKKNVKLFDSEKEIQKKKEEEEKKKKEMSKKQGMFTKLRGALKSDDRSLSEMATQARKDVTAPGFWSKNKK